jgi:hypothetical protein
MEFSKRLTETFAVIPKAGVLASQLSHKLYTTMIQGLGHALSFGLPSYYHARISRFIQGDQDAELAAGLDLSPATLNNLVGTWKTIRVASSFLCAG